MSSSASSSRRVCCLSRSAAHADAPRRKSLRWKSVCSRARCVATHGCLHYIRSSHRRWSTRRASALCGGISKRRTTCYSLKNSSAARGGVLRRLAFTASEDIVDMKGRVACEISSGDECCSRSSYSTHSLPNGVQRCSDVSSRRRRASFWWWCGVYTTNGPGHRVNRRRSLRRSSRRRYVM